MKKRLTLTRLVDGLTVVSDADVVPAVRSAEPVECVEPPTDLRRHNFRAVPVEDN